MLLYFSDTYDGLVSVGTFTMGHVKGDCFEELIRITKPGEDITLLQHRNRIMTEVCVQPVCITLSLMALCDTCRLNADILPYTIFTTRITNSYDISLTFPMLRLLSSKAQGCKYFYIFEKHLNPVMFVFIGKLSLSTFISVPIC